MSRVANYASVMLKGQQEDDKVACYRFKNSRLGCNAFLMFFQSFHKVLIGILVTRVVPLF